MTTKRGVTLAGGAVLALAVLMMIGATTQPVFVPLSTNGVHAGNAARLNHTNGPTITMSGSTAVLDYTGLGGGGAPDGTHNPITDTNFITLNASNQVTFRGGATNWGNEGIAGNLLVRQQIQATNGTATTPAYSFFNDPDTGLINAAANTLSIISGGSLDFQFTATQLEILNDNLIQFGTVGRNAFRAQDAVPGVFIFGAGSPGDNTTLTSRRGAAVDQAGSDLIVSGGESTGTASPGVLRLAVGTASGSSGNVLNAAEDAIRILPESTPGANAIVNVINPLTANTLALSNRLALTWTNLGAAAATTLDLTGRRTARYFPAVNPTITITNVPALNTDEIEVSVLVYPGPTNVTFAATNGITYPDGGPKTLLGQTNEYLVRWTGSNLVVLSAQEYTTGTGATALSNAPVITDIRLPGNGAAAGYMLTCTNPTTGQTEWRAPAGVTVANVRKGVTRFEEFDTGVAPGSFGHGVFGFASVNANGGTVSVGAGTSNAPGILQVSTGTSANGQGAFLNSQTAYALGGGPYTNEWRFRVANLPDGTEPYILYIGFIDSASTNSTDGVYLTLATNSANFIYNTRANGSPALPTTANSGLAAAANTWYKLTIEVNNVASSATFRLNDANAQTIASDVPGTARTTGMGVAINKIAGTTARTADVDYCLLGYVLDFSR
jgi:hypothetical protein